MSDLPPTITDEQRWEEAVGACLQAQALAPDNASIPLNLGLALSRLTRWEDAAAAFQRAAALDPEAFWPHYNLGDVWQALGRSEEAVAAYKRALALDPKMANAWVNLGHALSKLERWEEAVVAYGQAQTLAPDNASIPLNLGLALSRLTRWEEAATAFQRAAAIDPDALWPHYNLGDVWQALGRSEEAVAAYKRALALDPNMAITWVNLGHALMKLERWENAVTAYERALEVEPGNASAHLNAGTALAQLERWNEVAMALQRSIVLKPDVFWVHHNLGDVWQKLERWEDAITAYQQAISLEPENPASHKSLGLLLSNLERWEAAVSVYERATGVFPRVSSLQRDLGDALLKLGRLAEAGNAFQRANQNNPGWSRRELGAAVAAAQHWVEGLLPPADKVTTRGTRSLFVFDNDYGEVTTTMYLLLGQELATGATLLLPPRLYATNKDCLPGRTHPYRSLQDIIQAVDEEKPDVVFLCSAYLFVVHQIFTADTLAQLQQLLRARGCQVITTDPFLGLLSNLGRGTTIAIDAPTDGPPGFREVVEETGRKLVSDLASVVPILKDTIHLYPAFPAPPGRTGGLQAGRNISFFNPRLIRTVPEFRDVVVDPEERPIWVFVLASRDYELQAMFHGKDQFVDVVVRKIQEGLESQRHPVFIGPYDCVQAVIQRMGAAGGPGVTEGGTLLTFCPFNLFSALLLSAEYAFYWNSVSHSMFLRLFNHLPVFLFDRGHLVRNVTPLYRRVVEWYYQGWEPIYLEQEQELSVDRLGALAKEYRGASREVCRYLRRSPLPVQMMNDILQAGVDGRFHDEDHPIRRTEGKVNAHP